jgi:hypothetical protein
MRRSRSCYGFSYAHATAAPRWKASNAPLQPSPDLWSGREHSTATEDPKSWSLANIHTNSWASRSEIIAAYLNELGFRNGGRLVP